MTGIFYRSLIAGVDAAAASRVRDVSAGLSEDTPDDLDDPLLATDQRIDAVQVLTPPDGRVLRRSDSISDTPPLVPPLDQVSATLRTGMAPTDSPPDRDMRISAQSITTPHGPFIVVVAGGDDAAESTVWTAIILLLLAAPVVVAVAAVATIAWSGGLCAQWTICARGSRRSAALISPSVFRSRRVVTRSRLWPSP